jgi:hypothetical protein
MHDVGDDVNICQKEKGKLRHLPKIARKGEIEGER